MQAWQRSKHACVTRCSLARQCQAQQKLCAIFATCTLCLGFQVCADELPKPLPDRPWAQGRVMAAVGALTGSPDALSGITASAVSWLRGCTQPSFLEARGCPVCGCSSAAAQSAVPTSRARLHQHRTSQGKGMCAAMQVGLFVRAAALQCSTQASFPAARGCPVCGCSSAAAQLAVPTSRARLHQHRTSHMLVRLRCA